MFLLVNSSVHLHFLHIVPVPRWALIAVAVAVAILFLLFLICIIKCCCCKKKPKKKERVGLLAVSSSTAANLVRPAFPSPPLHLSLGGLVPSSLVLLLVGPQQGWDVAEHLLKVVFLCAAGPT